MIATDTDLVVKMILDRWHASIKSCDSMLSAINDEQLQKEISPGRNRGTYILGHLIAVHDDMLILLDMGPKLFPELTQIFIRTPDKSVAQFPSAAELRSYWTRQCEAMKQKFDDLKAEDWFAKHTAVSTEDFAKEPHRNKLNIVITRTSHLQYHLGQLVLLK